MIQAGRKPGLPKKTKLGERKKVKGVRHLGKRGKFRPTVQAKKGKESGGINDRHQKGGQNKECKGKATVSRQY